LGRIYQPHFAASYFDTSLETLLLERAHLRSLVPDARQSCILTAIGRG
jgi:hypothetical protein